MGIFIMAFVSWERGTTIVVCYGGLRIVYRSWIVIDEDCM